MIVNQNEMNKSKPQAVLLLLLFTIAVSSCDVGIHLDGANSFAAIIAVIGEYLLAIVSTVLVFVLHLSRPFSISLVLLSILGMTHAVNLPVSPYIVLTIGKYYVKIVLRLQRKLRFSCDVKLNTL